MDQAIEKLLKAADTFTITTIGSDGFPHAIAVSKPIERHGGFHRFKFYLNGEGQTVENIRHNRQGTLFCYDAAAHESLALKGYFFVEELDEYGKLAAQLNEFQQQLNYQHPVLVVFQTLKVKHFHELQTEFTEIEAID